MTKARNFKINPTKFKAGKWEIGTFDIETNGLLGEFIYGAICCPVFINGEIVPKVVYFDTIIGMVQTMLSLPEYRWFAHNGGGFDFRYIVNDDTTMLWLFANDYILQPIGGDIVKALCFIQGKQQVYFCDSVKLMPSKLSALTKSFGVENQKLAGEINFENGEVFDPCNARHIDYLYNDVVGLYQVLVKYRAVINETFGSEIKCTASSTSFSCWRNTLPETIYRHSVDVDEFCRNAYYGGRTQIFAQGEYNDVTYVDVNSLYAYIMREYGGLHSPYFTEHETEDAGFYHIKAHVPADTEFCPLPYRSPTGLLFPVGSFYTYASSLEIATARQLGCTVEVLEGCCFETNDKNLFRGFIDKCESVRSRDYSGALGLCAKYLQNNLYGYFGMKRERPCLMYSAHLPDDSYNPVINIKGEFLNGLWEKTEDQDTINIVPAWAAWVTSAARNYLLWGMIKEQRAGNTVLYCDTDSMFIQGNPVSPIDATEYGKFKIECVFDTWQGIAGKTYSGEISDSEKTVLKCKGIPNRLLKKEQFNTVLAGGSIEHSFEQLSSFNVVAKTGVMGKAGYTRKMPNPLSVSSCNPAENRQGKTSPIVLQEW